MDMISFAGLDLNRTSVRELLFNKAMLLGYALFALALIGVYELYHLRYFSPVLNAHDAGLNPTDPALIEAMQTAIFGSVGEIDRNLPWTIIISNYMFMLYTGSGIIFLVALAELMNLKVVAKVSVGFMVVGIGMVLAGLFTILTDLHVLSIHWMALTPNFGAAMWMMFPLYLVYIPFVLFEIYLLLTNNRDFARKLALPIVVLSIVVDVIEYYIQAKLFGMNTARHLWTGFPALTLYFIISAFVSALGVMGVYAYLVHRNKAEFQQLINLIRYAMVIFIIILGLYEVVGYAVADSQWSQLILFGPFSGLYFFAYVPLTFLLPLLLLLKAENPRLIAAASVLAILGSFVGRLIFVYGGNVVPMSNRFGTGYESNDIYGVAESFIFSPPHLGEILITVGSIGVVIIVYKLFDGLFSVGNLRENH